MGAFFVASAMATTAFAQAPIIQPLGWLDDEVRHSVARGVADDGSRVVGHSRSASGYDRPFLWTAAGGLQELGTLGNASGNSYAEAVSLNGIVVGHSYGPFGVASAYRWSASTGMVQLRSFDASYVGDSFAYDISPNGTYIVGSSDHSHYQTPTQWSGPTMSLTLALGDDYAGFSKGINDAAFNAGHVYIADETRSIAISTNGYVTSSGSESFAEAVSSGTTFVGHTLLNGRFVATRWANGAESFLHGNASVNSYAYDISSNGLVSVGELAAGSAARGDAYVWFSDRSPAFLRDFLANEYGVDMTGWGRLYQATACSQDGRVIVGYGEFEGATTAFRVSLPLANRRPTIATTLVQGQTYVVALGGTPFSRTLTGNDLDGDALTLGASGLPPSAVLAPNAGTIGPSPRNVTLSLTPTLADVGTRSVTISFADQAYAGNPASISFNLSVPANNIPTVSALNSESVECIDGTHLVELSATVNDADGHPMTVVWKVDGVAKQTTPGVASGTEVEFEYDYPHGQSAVTVEANDTYHTGSAGATVTVEDTTAPSIVVAPDVLVPTNPGQSFATGVVLTEPTVTDNCDGDPTFFNNAPSVYPLGDTIVTWTATDADGNDTTATQKVTVQDQESPVFGAIAPVRRFVDPGELFSSDPLVPPVTTDNVPAGLTVTGNAPTPLPLGPTVVTWTAEDAAGNQATATQNVTIVNRKPKASVGRAIKVTTRTERGARVKLDGSGSSDPDEHTLTFFWSAPGVPLKKRDTARPSGLFPIGTTKATLTVTDEAGASASKSVTVTVKLAGASPRGRGEQANEAFAQVFHHGTRCAVGSAPSSQGLVGYAYANAAQRTSLFLGEHVADSEDAASEYAELRAMQGLCGELAADAYFDAYAETGDEDALYAAIWALNGAAYANADVIEP